MYLLSHACGHSHIQKSHIKETTASKLGRIAENKISNLDKTIENSTFEDQPEPNNISSYQKQVDEHSMHSLASASMGNIANVNQLDKTSSAGLGLAKEHSGSMEHSRSLITHPLDTADNRNMSTKDRHTLNKEQYTHMQAQTLEPSGNGYSSAKEKNVSVVRPSNFDQVAYATAAVASLAHTTAAVASFTKPKLRCF